MRADLGDFQTPPGLVHLVLDAVGGRWSRVLEPTCGRGHFLAGLLARPEPPAEFIGIEIQGSHLEEARLLSGPSTRVGLIAGSLFDLDLGRDLDWQGDGPLLVVGNPPWVTSAALGVLGSENRPRASARSVGLAGLEARTGRSNFDLAEATWLKLIRELAPQRPTIALLCKTSVARRVLAHADREGFSITDATIHGLDARGWFRASVDACLLRITLGDGLQRESCRVFRDLETSTGPASSVAFRSQIADAEADARSSFADGPSPLEWRQGIKHDAAFVLELVRDGLGWRNGLGEPVDVEPRAILPLLKSGDLHRGPGPDSVERGLIVPQVDLGDRGLDANMPRLRLYLEGHADVFARRKSSIYRGRPPFAIFGVGGYSFTSYKVCVSGLHKSPRFRAIGPIQGRPVVVDDASYVAPCRSAEHAALAAALLEDPIAVDRLAATMFPGSKRPLTKAILARVDLLAILGRAEGVALAARFRDHHRRLVAPPVDP